MKELPEEKLDRTDLLPEDGEEMTFSLEDIMREFSSRPQPEGDPEPEYAPEPDPEPEYAPEPESEPEPDPEPREQHKFRFLRMDGSEAELAAHGPAIPSEPAAAPPPQEPARRQRPVPETERRPAEEPEEFVREWKPRRAAPVREEMPAEEPAEATPERQPEAKQERKPRKEPIRRKAVSPESAFRQQVHTAGLARVRTAVAALLSAASLALTLADRVPQLRSALTEQYNLRFLLLIGLMFLTVVLAGNLVARGVTNVMRRRFGVESLLLLAMIAVAADAWFAYGQQRLPLCAVITFGYAMALWGDSLTRVGRGMSLKMLAHGEARYVVVRAEGAYEEHPCLYRQEGTDEEYVEKLEQPALSERIFAWYSLAAVAAATVVSVLAAVLKGQEFLWCWAVTLCGALPASAFCCYARPFAVLSRRLLHNGAALCGWSGVTAVTSDACLIVRENDLFPKGSVTLNGMKVFHEFRPAQMVSYAASAVMAAESGLTPLFEALLKEQGGRILQINSFHVYEGGGIGAEIAGDVVLVGTLDFMRLMGVEIPEGTKMKQAAYVSINNTLAGVVALNYQPMGAVRKGLRILSGRHGLTCLVAARDFVITRGLLRHKFRISAGRLEFPVVRERERLLELDRADQKLGYLTRDSFQAFAEVAAGAKNLRMVVLLGMAIGLAGGILGLLLMGFLAVVGAAAVATADNILLYVVLWTIPVLLVTTWANKY